MNKSESNYKDSDSTPIIILKKGKVELKIKNAAAIIKKIDEWYPSDGSDSGWNINWNRRNRELSNIEKDKQIRWIEAAKNWFKQEIFGGLEDFEVIVNENTSTESKNCFGGVNKESSDIKNGTEKNILTNVLTSEEMEYLPTNTKKIIPSSEVKSVNKNAYEIRADILGQSLAWIQYKRSFENINSPVPTEEDVLLVANKFYKFVENKK